MNSLTHRRVLTAAGLSATVLLAFGSLAAADEPEHAAVIRACVNQHTGDVRIPGRGGCGPFERPIKWNVRGPQGPAGLADGRTVEQAVSVPAGSDGTSVVVSCPEGTVATGGGFALSSGELNVLINRPVPVSAGPVTGWQLDVGSTSEVPRAAIVYAVCYTAPA